VYVQFNYQVSIMATINFNLLSDLTSTAPKRAPEEINDSDIENENGFMKVGELTCQGKILVHNLFFYLQKKNPQMMKKYLVQEVSNSLNISVSTIRRVLCKSKSKMIHIFPFYPYFLLASTHSMREDNRVKKIVGNNNSLFFVTNYSYVQKLNSLT